MLERPPTWNVRAAAPPAREEASTVQRHRQVRSPKITSGSVANFAMQQVLRAFVLCVLQSAIAVALHPLRVRHAARASLPLCCSAYIDDGSALPVPGPSIQAPTAVETKVHIAELGVVLQVAQSLVAPGERGLFIRLADDFPRDHVVLPAGRPLCGYCGGANVFTDAVRGNMAVPFAFDSAQSVVLYHGELRPLQQVVTESGADGVYAHRVQRYGPGGAGVMVTRDEAVTRRVLVPDEARAAAAGGVPGCTREGVAQFCNDHAYSPDLLERKEAGWTYERASFERNLLILAWSLRPSSRDEPLDEPVHDPTPWADRPQGSSPAQGARATTLVPGAMCAVLARAARLDRSAGSVELGLHYGIDYWRQRRDV